MKRHNWFLFPSHSIKDDAGNDVTLDLESWRSGPAARNNRTRPSLVEARAFVQKCATVGNSNIHWGHATGALTGIFVIFATALRFPTYVVWSGAAMLGMSTSVVGRRAQAAGVRRGRDYLVSLLTQHGMCVGCAYDLSASVPDETGRVCCPECGGVWDASRMTRAVPIMDMGSTPVSQHVAGTVRSLRNLLRRSMIADDRGRFVPLMGRHPSEWCAQAKPPASADTKSRLKRAQNKGRADGRVVRWIFVVLLVINAAAVLLIIVPLFSRGAGAAWMPYFMVALGLFMLFQAWVLGKSNLLVRPLRAKRILLEASACPSCGCDLVGVERNFEEVSVCPECGAGWQVSAELA